LHKELSEKALNDIHGKRNSLTLKMTNPNLDSKNSETLQNIQLREENLSHLEKISQLRDSNENLRKRLENSETDYKSSQRVHRISVREGDLDRRIDDIGKPWDSVKDQISTVDVWKQKLEDLYKENQGLRDEIWALKKDVLCKDRETIEQKTSSLRKDRDGAESKEKIGPADPDDFETVKMVYESELLQITMERDALVSDVSALQDDLRQMEGLAKLRLDQLESIKVFFFF
jgi:hypothetical protein